jgi:hypothetical protein
VLGIDEHFFSRRHGYATTFCDLRITGSSMWCWGGVRYR